MFINKFIKDIYNKGNFKDFFKRNKLFILTSCIILILSVISGYNHSSSYLNVLASYKSIISQVCNDNIFINNLVTIISGLTLSVISIIVSLFNGVNLGVTFSNNSSIIALVSMFFELLSYIFALTGSFLVTKMEIRTISAILNKDFDKITSKIKVPLKDLILTITFIVIFIIIMLIINF